MTQAGHGLGGWVPAHIFAQLQGIVPRVPEQVAWSRGAGAGFLEPQLGWTSAEAFRPHWANGLPPASVSRAGGAEAALPRLTEGVTASLHASTVSLVSGKRAVGG